MMTKKENFLATIRGEDPERYVNQFEFLEFIYEAPMEADPPPGTELVNGWGITWRWPEGQLGAFPVHDEEHKVLKDITRWREQVKAPSVVFDEARWADAIAHANAIDRNEKFVSLFVAPGIFEMTHHLMSMEDALTAYYEEPEAMHELIDYLTEWEISYAKELIDHLHPDCLYHHDDWGSQISTFMSPAMFEEFILPAYKKIYQYYRDNGVEIIIHHSDSFAATLVPYMIDMGVDVWQGVMTTNNTPELIKKYGGQITFMGNIDSGSVDFPGWTPEIIAEHVERACRECGTKYFIPNLTQGMDFDSFPGVYKETSAAIERMSEVMFNK
ncbi:uroporphyrinogen decarboxylase [Alkalibacter rhizosphaerae]|uniref:Uroporphyrinogen decarboxylase n=1 Tax=Alkalibacter rhizosphaerae TaxID=2815577 RepID=A0A974XG34_9FIRM|nr:uroporphyrinogen decarboxylase family protein [Alkalibacter rhizosphaerae]QSX07653.1 uroporphyrinogen decarboxylase [Alkalibacter rhizosphaerae]